MVFLTFFARAGSRDKRAASGDLAKCGMFDSGDAALVINQSFFVKFLQNKRKGGSNAGAYSLNTQAGKPDIKAICQKTLKTVTVDPKLVCYALA